MNRLRDVLPGWRGLLGSVAAAALALSLLVAGIRASESAAPREPAESIPIVEGEGPAHEGALRLTDDTFRAAVARGVALVDFWSERCPPCREQGPVVDALARRYDGRATVAKLDVDANRRTPGRYRVRYIPTLVVLRDGRELRRFVGLQSEEALAEAIESALGDG